MLHSTRPAFPPHLRVLALATVLTWAPLHPPAAHGEGAAGPAAADSADATAATASAAGPDSVVMLQVTQMVQQYCESAAQEHGGRLPVYDQIRGETVQLERVGREQRVRQTGERGYAVNLEARTRDGQVYGLDVEVLLPGAGAAEPAAAAHGPVVARIVIQRGPDGERYLWKEGDEGYWVRQYGPGAGDDATGPDG